MLVSAQQEATVSGLIDLHTNVNLRIDPRLKATAATCLVVTGHSLVCVCVCVCVVFWGVSWGKVMGFRRLLLLLVLFSVLFSNV